MQQDIGKAAVRALEELRARAASLGPAAGPVLSAVSITALGLVGDIGLNFQDCGGCGGGNCDCCYPNCDPTSWWCR